MVIKTLVLGELRTNCYIVVKGGECLIIDPASDAPKIIEECQNYRVVAILVTHHHFDHVLALEELEEYYHLKHNVFKDKMGYQVIKTPGHAADCLTFYFAEDKVMFTGDFIFYHTCGRCDLETSNEKDMRQSLEMMKKYPDDIVIYPGHGSKTNLGEEKKFFDSYFA